MNEVSGLPSGGKDALLSVIVAGDLCPSGPAGVKPDPDRYQAMLCGVREVVSAADISIVNLECPLTRRWAPIRKSGPHLRADPVLAEAIRSAGFGVVSLANNHIRDMGGKGVRDTMVACTDAGLRTVGAGSNLAEAMKPLIVGVGATKLAILAFAEHEFSIATESSAGAWPLDPIDNHRQISEIREQVDIVLVILHGGNEWYALPSPRMVKTCRFLVESGADAVVCHHGHVPGGMETYRGKPIVYGTGNFLFTWPGARHEGWFYGYLVSLMIRAGLPTTVRLIPYEQCRRTAGVRFLEEAEAGRFLAEISRLSALISDEAALNAEWASFCRSRRVGYLSTALSLNRVERTSLRRGVWPFWRMRRRGLAEFLNLFSNEAHRDAVTAILSAELEGGEEKRGRKLC